MFEPLAALSPSTSTENSLPRSPLGRRERVLQVLSNLVTNAIKSRRGGAITLCADAVPGHVQFAVSDVGVGIPEEQRPHVFERYWKGEKGGRGEPDSASSLPGESSRRSGTYWFETRVAEGTTSSSSSYSQHIAVAALPPGLRQEASLSCRRSRPSRSAQGLRPVAGRRAR